MVVLSRQIQSCWMCVSIWCWCTGCWRRVGWVM